MVERKVKLKNRNGDYLYPYTNNVPTADISAAGIVKLDNTPVAESKNAITSGAVQKALASKLAKNETAIKATADANGNNIVNTYATKNEVTEIKNQTAIDSSVVHKTGNEEINGIKTFHSTIIATASEEDNSVVTTLAKSKNSNGYYKFGNGLIIQWGLANTGGTVTLPTPFSSTDYSVVLTRINTDTKYHSGSYIQTLTTTNFSFNGADANGSPHKWLAIGY